MPKLDYNLVDVFTSEPLAGNALAVFTDGRGVADETMQKIAAELNLPETTFVFPTQRPSCVAKVRIFTPKKEMDFAGHPTIGTAAVLARKGLAGTEGGKFALEETVGDVRVEIEKSIPEMIWLETPPIEQVKTFTRVQCAAALGLEEKDLHDVDPQLLSAGNPTLLVALRSQEAVDRASFSQLAMRDLRRVWDVPFCVFIFSPRPGGAYSRMFAPDYGIPEDPATGSSTGPLLQYMLDHGLTNTREGQPFVSEQGTKMGRRSLLHARVSDQKFYVGGNVTDIGNGTLNL